MSDLEAGKRGGPPDPIDVHVGQRMEQRRKYLRMSQEQLAVEVKCSWQQVAKREKGINRISASALWKTAKVLGVKVGFFFEGLKK